MINSKKALYEALKRGEPLTFTTTRNGAKVGHMVGVERTVGSILQTNAFTVKTPKGNGEFVNSWMYFADIDVNNNMITFKNADIEVKIGKAA